jgi:hypothetical protein
MKTTMTTAQRAEELVNTKTFPEFHASIHQGKLGECVLTTTRKMVYLRGKSRDAFRLVSCGRFLRIAAGKEAWI